MSEETVDERRARQSAAQFEALGRFVQSFERMVQAARGGCQWVTQGSMLQAKLMVLVWNHQMMTAKPLFDLYRAMLTAIVQEFGDQMDPAERGATLSILSEEQREFDVLISMRNTLLHGNWMIGSGHQGQEDFSELKVFKLKTTSQGVRHSSTPKSVVELMALVDRCERSGRVLTWLPHMLLDDRGPRVTRNIIRRADGKWEVPGALRVHSDDG